MGLTNSIAANLRKPSSGFIGRFVNKQFKEKNKFLELNAVRLCGLEPHHHVLEIGFGPGIGLKAAAEVVKDGRVYGIDFSPYMVQEASTSLHSLIASGRLQVELGDAASLPYPDASMDRIFHCNCYYFWPEPKKVAGELYRVLKPNSLMVSTLLLHAVQQAVNSGLLPGTNWEPKPYMDVLRSAGFTDVALEDLVYKSKRSNKEVVYQAIYAYKK